MMPYTFRGRNSEEWRAEEQRLRARSVQITETVRWAMEVTQAASYAEVLEELDRNLAKAYKGEFGGKE